MRGALLVGFICANCVAVQSARAAIGDIYVTGDSAGTASGLYRIDPVTGTQSRIIANVDSNNGVAIDITGAPLMVNGFVRQIWRYDPSGQTYTTFRVESDFQPQVITTDQTARYFVGGMLYDAGGPHPALDVIDPAQGAQRITPLSVGGLAIARTTDQQTLLASDNLYVLTNFRGGTAVISPGPLLGGVTVAPDGTVYGATANGVVRIDLATGARTVISAGGFFAEPIALAVDPQGNIDVVDHMYLGGSIIRVDPRDGAQTVVASGGILNGTYYGAIAVVVPEPGCWASSLAGFTLLLTRSQRKRGRNLVLKSCERLLRSPCRSVITHDVSAASASRR